MPTVSWAEPTGLPTASRAQPAAPTEVSLTGMVTLDDLLGRLLHPQAA